LERYDELVAFDETEVYEGVVCPKCKSSNKNKLISLFGILGPTSSKMDNFGYRAGYNMEKAKDCRRQAEEASHMGTDPYSSCEFGTPPDDFAGDEGLFHPSEMPKD